MREIRTEDCPCCVLCGERGEAIYSELADVLFGAPGRWNLSRCPNPACGLIWLNPRPVDEDLPLVYREYYTHGNPSGEANRPQFPMRDFLFACYEKASFLPALLVGLQRHKQRIRLMFLGDLPCGRLLDVGCGDGTYLDQMRRRGWRVDGLDFDAAALETARQRYGLNPHCGDLSTTPFPAGAFDAVTMKHVIEHVPHPADFLRHASELLKPGGRLVVVTPNTSSLGHSAFQSSWRGLEPPRHLHIFSVKNLEQCARQAGLNPLYAGSTAANADAIIGASYSLQENARRVGHVPVPSVTRTLKALFYQYRECSRLSLRPDCGEEAVLVCSKPLESPGTLASSR